MHNCDILLVARSLDRGGAERQLSVLARRLHVLGYRVAIALFYAEGALLPEIVASGIPVVDLEKKGRWANLGVARNLLRFVSSTRPQIVYSFLPPENILVLLLKPWIRRRGAAIVCGIRVARFDARSHGLLLQTIYICQFMLLRWADRVISNSADALHQLSRWIPRGRGYLVPNGVEAERFRRDTVKRLTQRAAWEVPDSHVVIGIVGRLDPQKNHRTMITVFGEIVKSLPATVLVVIGAGPAEYQASLVEHAEALGIAPHIVWAGAMDDMTGAYSAIDVLCLPSLAEGFPNVVAEAMCVGLPCVATDVGDTAAVIGEAGWVIAPNDEAALLAALTKAIKALPDWDHEKPRRHIVECFSEAMLADRTLAALQPFLNATHA